MSETIEAARKLITDRLGEIERESKRLRRALEGLGPAVGTRPMRSKPRRGKAAGKRRRGSTAKPGRRREQLLAAIESAPGARPSELAKAIGVAPSQAHSLISKSRAAGEIVKKDRSYELKKQPGRDQGRDRST